MGIGTVCLEEDWWKYLRVNDSEGKSPKQVQDVPMLRMSSSSVISRTIVARRFSF
jgi:hypothetical protein